MLNGIVTCNSNHNPEFSTASKRAAWVAETSLTIGAQSKKINEQVRLDLVPGQASMIIHNYRQAMLHWVVFGNGAARKLSVQKESESDS